MSLHHHHHDPNHHVQFSASEAGDNFGGDNEIIVNGFQQDGDVCKLDVHLGFLQVNHRYEVIVRLPNELRASHGIEQHDTSSLHCRLVSVTEDATTGATVLTVEFFAQKEKLVKEEMMLSLPGAVLKVTFHARVLGRGKGTPMLKNGVRCIGMIEDEESEASDWQGFS
ncbi:hypothetical protein B566_EDAN010138 [Ephemera danica]|nr:hypothetical protein B566_EDAN010138 [Ephemera danica]